MNRLLLDASEIVRNGRTRLGGRRARHLLDVLDVEPGRELLAGVLDRGQARATVMETTSDSVLLRIDSIVSTPPLPELRLILALPRPKTVRRIVLDATTLGVTRIDLVNAWRVDKSYFGSPLLSAERLEFAARLGAEQGGRVRLPQVTVYPRLMLCLEALEMQGGEVRWLADPDGARWLGRDPFEGDPSRPVWMAIGPERGWIEREIETLTGLGFSTVRLADGILRSETAATSALSQIALLRGLAGSGAESSGCRFE